MVEPSSLYNWIPELAGAENRSLLQPYIEAKVRRWLLAAEKLKEVDCPGRITGGVPFPWKVPVSTNGLLSSTFSMVMVADWPDGLSSTLSQEARNNTAPNNVH